MKDMSKLVCNVIQN